MASKNYRDWLNETYKPSLQKEPFMSRATMSIVPEPLYLADSEEEAKRLGFPGRYPYLRGPYPSMYLGRPWTMRQYAGFSSAEETNARYRYLLDQGQTGLSVAFDLPTQIGYDPDHPFSEGEVGKVGVSIAIIDDMDCLLDGIPLDKVSISMTINATASILLAMLVVLAKRRGVDTGSLRGTVQNDILKEYVARGTYHFPVRPSMRIITDMFRYCRESLPRFNPISISGYHMREAGCSAVQEIAFTLGHGIAYVQAAVDAGLDVDSFARRLSFFFNAHNNFFEEIAKFRAARRLWARIMRERFKAKKDESCMLRFHTQTAGSTLTAVQPDVNVVRVTLQALAAVMGGTQSLHTNSRDEALALPTEESARIALRTQQVIAFESGVTNSIDPLGGAPFIESLTDDLECEAEALIHKLDDLGGAVAAVESGFTASEISKAAYAYQMAVEKDETVVVGVNRFHIEEPPPEGLLRVDDSLRPIRIQQLDEIKSQRDADKLGKSLARLGEAAKGDTPLMPVIVDCVDASATVGEICAVFEKVFGKYRSRSI